MHKQTWIIQFNPRDWSLRDHLRGLYEGQYEREGEWPIRRYQRQLSAGDRDLLWQSGPDAGIWAVGELLSAAYRAPQEQSEPWFVGYRLNEALKPPLLRQELKADARLQELLILRRPQGQVFAVTEAEAKALDELLSPRLQVLPSESVTETLPALMRRIQRQGLWLSEQILRRYHLALQASALVILAGPSGMGKSWLTRAYAQAVGARYLLVPVAPNWTGPEDLLGYYNALSDRFQATVVTRFIQEAQADWLNRQQQGLRPNAFHLVLDEINLARVEYYLAPLLSALEVRRRGETAQVFLADGSELRLPENLYLIGSLNMDESTQALSDKVLDRAQVLELDMDLHFLEKALSSSPWRETLLSLWQMLSPLVPLSYRSLEDIQTYLERAVMLGCSWQKALDEQVVQKILPRLRYLKALHLPLLEELQQALPSEFGLTHRKLQQMIEAIQEQGFGAYF